MALTPVPQEELKSFTGQAGISAIMEDTLGVDWSADKIAFGDSDGTDGTPAFLCLNNVEYAGRVTLNNPVLTTVSSEKDPYTGMVKAGINIEMNGAVVEIDRYHIDSITIEGAAAGTNFVNAGKSFGSITVEGFYAEITGKIRITTD